jgi:diguanylate cyclase (GGDEF)-like protein/PAS domain S-box-containing protein
MAAGSVRWSTSSAYWRVLARRGYANVRKIALAQASLRDRLLRRLVPLSPQVLLVVVAADHAETIRASLAASREGLATLAHEYLTRCDDAVERLRGDVERTIAAVVLEIAHSQELVTLARVLRMTPHIPVLVVTGEREENTARQAVQQGAQDYLLWERLDAYSLPKALAGALQRAANTEAQQVELKRASVTLNSIGDGVVTVDATGNVGYLNAVAEQMTGWPRHEATGLPLGQVLRIINGDTREPVPNPLELAMRHNKPVSLSPNSVLVRRDGHESAIADTAAPIHGDDERIEGAVIVFHDISETRAAAERMAHLAHHDHLTGLPNRLLLDDRLAQAIRYSQRHRRSLGVLFLDVNGFKDINDTRGHAVGDQLLKSIALKLVGAVRGSDTVGRLGGDEFVVVLPDVTGANDIRATVKKILAALDRPHRLADLEIRVSLSAGLAVYPDDGLEAEVLLARADAALYANKANSQAAPANTPIRADVQRQAAQSRRA